MRTIREKIQTHIREMLFTQASPHEVALGFAVGTFIEILPLYGLKTVLSLVLAARVKKINKAALLSALAVWNSLFLIPIYSLSVKLGNYVFNLPGCPVETDVQQSGLSCFVFSFIPGVLLMAAIMAGLMYITLWGGITIYRQRKGDSINVVVPDYKEILSEGPMEAKEPYFGQMPHFKP
jgi:uncharacterized protein (DUF2062 family)